MATNGGAVIFSAVGGPPATVGGALRARGIPGIADALREGGAEWVALLGPIDDPAVGPGILTGDDAETAIEAAADGSPVVFASAELVLLSAVSARAVFDALRAGAVAVAADDRLAGVRWRPGRVDDVRSVVGSDRPVARIVERLRAAGVDIVPAIGIPADDLIALDAPAGYPAVVRIARRRAVDRLIRSGVWIEDPDETRVDGEVSVAPGALLLAGVRLRGPVEIGPDCVIGPDCTIESSTIEAGCVVASSVVEGARVRAGSRIGPYARLRPGADVGPDARVGNYVEVKAARLERGVKVGHLAYIGDAVIGAGANIGAGAITCNYDGRAKRRTVIGAGAFIGSNAALVAPVTIGEGAVIAAGSTITEDVPPGTLAFGRARQVVIERDRDDEEGG